jgi:anthranilate synthase component 1
MNLTCIGRCALSTHHRICFILILAIFSIFGSSPEAQITIKNRVASIYPIAGTFKRTGDDEKDAEISPRSLENDPKESAEHVMLVDLARNDLSRHCTTGFC